MSQIAQTLQKNGHPSCFSRSLCVASVSKGARLVRKPRKKSIQQEKNTHNSAIVLRAVCPKKYAVRDEKKEARSRFCMRSLAKDDARTRGIRLPSLSSATHLRELSGWFASRHWAIIFLIPPYPGREIFCRFANLLSSLFEQFATCRFP